MLDIEAWNLDIDAVRYRRKMDIEHNRSSKLRYRYIPSSKISRYRQMLLRYLYTIEALRFNIVFRVLRYRCFFAWAAVAPAQYIKQIAVYTISCTSSVR
jgi:hypothetical protein